MSATAEKGEGGPPPKRGDSLRSRVRYFQETESHFSARFGAPLLLSPRDVAKVEFWRSLGIPVSAVKRGIDRHFERLQPQRRRKAVVLAFCENDVLDAWEELRAHGSAGAKAGKPEDAAASLKKFLKKLEKAKVRAAVHGPWAESLFDGLLAAGRRALESKRAPSHEKTALRLEKLLRREMLRLAPPELLEELRHEVGAELAPYRPRMQESAYRETLDAQTMERLRERLHVPHFPL